MRLIVGYNLAMIDILSPLIDDICNVGDMAYEKYRSDVKVTYKSDNTPVTNVDHLVHTEILKSLNHFFPDIPVISEEGSIPSFNKRKNMDQFWLLDPLDGTVDFINETDEFVISLGLISKKKPNVGIIHHPVSGKTWIAISKCGVFVKDHGGNIQPVKEAINRDAYIILVSAHRNDDDLSAIIARQRQRELNRPVVVRPMGSALKLAYLAEGSADEYLRFTPMKEWDFAAGHCLIKEAGFKVFPLDNESSINYGSKDLMIPAISIRK